MSSTSLLPYTGRKRGWAAAVESWAQSNMHSVRQKSSQQDQVHQWHKTTKQSTKSSLHSYGVHIQ
eukprot:scaffold311011_cov22-Tisochrysis_lutea.AAC.1